jgi:hypothetical protein
VTNTLPSVGDAPTGRWCRKCEDAEAQRAWACDLEEAAASEEGHEYVCTCPVIVCGHADGREPLEVVKEYLKP